MLDTTPETLRDHETAQPAQRAPGEVRLRRLNAQAATRDRHTPLECYRNLIAAAGAGTKGGEWRTREDSNL